MAQTIKLKRSSVSGNTPSTSDLELGEVAINTYDGKMFIKKNDGSDSIVEIGGTSGTVTEAFKTIAVSGQSNVVADSATDTLTLVAGSNMTITTNASGDTITFASSGGGGTQNVFSTFAVSGQNNVVADSSTDTITFAAGSGINITTNAGTDTITIAATASAITVQDEGSSLSTAATTLNFVGAGVTASGTGATKTITIGGGGGSQNLFSNIGVSGQGTIQADSTTDTLTFEAGTGISLATDTTNDKLTITATGGAASVANAASSIKEFKYDITSSTTTITGSDANSNTLAYEAGAIQVFLNGILLDPATDYTASNGTSVVLTDAAVSGDDVQIVAFNRKIVTANVGLSTFTGDGTTTAFTLSSDPVNENNTRVHIDGVYQEKAAYSVSGTTLTFSGAPPNGSSIEVEIGFTQAEIGSTLDFADNAILRIGTGNDLQILHDGSNSIIKDTGTGDLQIAASTLEVKNSGLSETMLKAIEDGAVELYFDNSKKLETVTGGVTITGTVTATTFSGDLSGTINTATTGTTQSASDNSTKLATTAYVTTALANLVDSAPGTLNTLNELAAALGDDANFSTTITNSLNLKVGRDSATGAASIPAGTTAQRPGSPAAGQFRYNSTLNQFEGYTSSWGAIGGGGTNTFTTDVFTSSGSAAFTLTQAVASPNDCIVHIDGIYQTPTDAYTVSGTTLTFTATPASGRKVVVYSIKAGVSGNNVEVQTINGNGTDHTFTLNVNPVNENNTIVHIDGVYQQKSSYTVSGTSLSFGSGNIPANGTVIEVATFTQTEINVPVNDTIDTVHIKDDAVTSAKLGGNLVAPGTVTASAGFVGPLTGNVTGNVSGTAATVTGAAQTNITSVGTLSALTVTGGVTAARFDATTASTTDPVLQLTDSGVADYDFTFPDTSTIQLGTNTTSDKTFKLLNSGSGTFNLSVEGSVGIGTSSPDLAFHVDGTNAYPATSGTTPNGMLTLRDKTGSATHGLYMGVANASPWGSWLQASDAGNLGTEYPLLLNPNGGNVGIGTTNPDGTLHLKSTATGATPSLIFENTNNAQTMNIDYYNNSGSVQSRIRYSEGPGSFEIMPNASANAAMILLYNGNVGIGTTNPQDKLHIALDSSTTNAEVEVVRVEATSSGTPVVGFGPFIDFRGDRQAGSPDSYGRIGFEADAMTSTTVDGAFVVQTAEDGTYSERMRISSDGNVLLGTDTTAAGNEGVVYFAGNSLRVTRDSNEPLVLDRLTNQGKLVEFRQAGTTRGLIGTVANDLFICTADSGHHGLRFHDNGILPTDNTGAIVNAAADLGDPSYRFKDLFMSGDISIVGGSSGGTITVDPTSGDAELLLQGAAGAQTLRLDQNSIRTSTNSPIAIFTNNLTNRRIHIQNSTDNNSQNLVGIGTASPQAALHVNGSYSGDNNGDAIFIVEKNTSNDWSIRTNAGSDNYGILTVGNGSYALSVYNQPSSAHRARFNYNGELYLNGGSSALYNINSDVRLKEEISDAPSQWELIKGLPLQRFKWIDRREGEKWSYGFIAQEVEKTNPEFVELVPQDKEDEDNGVEDPEYKTVAEGQIHERALAALQEAMQRIEALEAEVNALKGE